MDIRKWVLGVFAAMIVTAPAAICLAAVSLHVNDMELRTRKSGQYTILVARVAIVDDEGVPVSGATVSGVYEKNGNTPVTCDAVTDSNGLAVFEWAAYANLRRGDVVSFTVTNVISPLLYAPNVEDVVTVEIGAKR